MGFFKLRISLDYSKFSLIEFFYKIYVTFIKHSNLIIIKENIYMKLIKLYPKKQQKQKILLNSLIYTKFLNKIWMLDFFVKYSEQNADKYQETL